MISCHTHTISEQKPQFNCAACQHDRIEELTAKLDDALAKSHEDCQRLSCVQSALPEQKHGLTERLLQQRTTIGHYQGENQVMYRVLESISRSDHLDTCSHELSLKDSTCDCHVEKAMRAIEGQ